MKVVEKDGKAQHINAEVLGEKLKPCFEPPFAMIKVFSGQRIISAQKAASDAPVDAMPDGDLPRIKHFNTAVCFVAP